MSFPFGEEAAEEERRPVRPAAGQTSAAAAEDPEAAARAEHDIVEIRPRSTVHTVDEEVLAIGSAAWLKLSSSTGGGCMGSCLLNVALVMLFVVACCCTDGCCIVMWAGKAPTSISVATLVLVFSVAVTAKFVPFRVAQHVVRVHGWL